ncbi:hypothetical protein ZIOFF_057652 [Zingiber officinale]|uniref:Adenylyl-sulfate kinase n=1 Tax=Zingiber officinale TaxID=94328 RepID=A0A8J5F591_ZINOF|nr:hypothetical protein ZIOFF_057652 [Zingiber officinale]
MFASAPLQPPTTNLGFRRAVVSVEKRIGRSSVITPGSARLRHPSPRLEAVSRGEEQCCDSTGTGNNNLLSLCLASDGIYRSYGWKWDPNSIVGILQLRCIARASPHVLSTVGKSTNILWHECPVGKLDRQKLLGQKGCVVWITGLSGSGKSTLACSLSRELHHKGYLTYILDGDNIRHGLNGDLSFNAEDRTENIRRVGEVAKLFADAGVICIASLISPYRKERDACRAIMPDSSFIEVFLNIPLEVCEARDPKGLYRLARAGKIKGFTGIDDPYEPPLNCEITIELEDGKCPTPKAMAEEVAFFLEKNGFLQG